MKVDISRNKKIRPRIVIHEHDAWDAASTLALIILPLLKRIKSDKDGVPVSFSPKYPDDWEYDGENDPYFDIARKNWEEVLDAMIFSMEAIAFGKNGIDFPKSKCCANLTWKEKDRRFWQTIPVHGKDGNVIGHRQIHTCEYDSSEMQKWREDQKNLDERIQKGCELFGKYFQNLWS